MEPAFIDQFYDLFISAVTVGMVALSSWVSAAMIGIFAIRLFYVIAEWKDGKLTGIGLIIGHVVPMVVLSYLSVEWVNLTRMLAANAMELGQIASGNQGHAIGLFQISEIILNGFRLVKIVWDYMAKLSTGPVSFAKNFWFLGYYTGASIIILVAQFYVAYIIFRSNIEYALHSLGTLAMMPFAGAKQTAWMVQNGLGGFIAHLINLMLLSVAVNIGQPLMERATLDTEPSYQQAGLMAGVAIMYAGLCFIIRNMSQGFINGGPALNGSGGIGGAMIGLATGMLTAMSREGRHRQHQVDSAHGSSGRLSSGGGSSGRPAGSGAQNGVLSGSQWADNPSPYSATLQEAKTGYRQAFEDNVAKTPNLPGGFADGVRGDFNKVNESVDRRAADLMRKGYWESFGFGNNETKPPIGRSGGNQIKP